MSITISQITKLRQATSAGIMDCKKALLEAKGDMEKAKLILNQFSIIQIIISCLGAEQLDKQIPHQFPLIHHNNPDYFIYKRCLFIYFTIVWG